MLQACCDATSACMVAWVAQLVDQLVYQPDRRTGRQQSGSQAGPHHACCLYCGVLRHSPGGPAHVGAQHLAAEQAAGGLLQQVGEQARVRHGLAKEAPGA